MKHILATTVALFTVIAMSGCGGDAPSDADTVTEKVEEVENIPEPEQAKTEVVRFADMNADEMSREQQQIYLWVTRSASDAFVTWSDELMNYCASYGCENVNDPSAGGILGDFQGAGLSDEARQMIAIATMRTQPGWGDTNWAELEPLFTDICDLVEMWGGREYLAMELTRDDPSKEAAQMNAYLTTASIGSLCPSAWGISKEEE